MCVRRGGNTQGRSAGREAGGAGPAEEDGGTRDDSTLTRGGVTRGGRRSEEEDGGTRDDSTLTRGGVTRGGRRSGGGGGRRGTDRRRAEKADRFRQREDRNSFRHS